MREKINRWREQGNKLKEVITDVESGCCLIVTQWLSHNETHAALSNALK